MATGIAVEAEAMTELTPSVGGVSLQLSGEASGATGAGGNAREASGATGCGGDPFSATRFDPECRDPETA